MPATVARDTTVVNENAMEVLRMPATQQALPLNVSFERVLEQLEANPSCHTEPDGWFLWTGNLNVDSAEAIFWSLSGQLTDDGTRMLFVTLKGKCPKATLVSLRDILSEGGDSLMFQLPELGVFLDEAAFEAYL